MSKSELLETLNNCELLSKKLKLEICNSNVASLRSDTVKCLDVLKAVHSENNDENVENSSKKLTSISPPFPPRRRLRGVLQNRTNVPDAIPDAKAAAKKAKEKEKILKDATNPGTISELISKVPSVQKYFNVKKRVGCGTFSSVFLASEKQSDVEAPRNHYALKHIYSCSANTKRVLFETKCLKQIGGCDNVVRLKSIMGHGSENVLVMPYYRHDRFSILIKELSLEGVRRYMKSLLIALRRVHKFNVIHRDVKPSNFLYDMKSGSCALVDFGLAHNAHFFKPSERRSESVQQRTRTKSVPISVQPAKPRSVKQIKKSGSVTSTRTLTHTRSSSMVAMAKSIHKLSAVGPRKRSADEDTKPAERTCNSETPGKRPCIKPDMLDLAQCSADRFIGTPRPTFRHRPGFETRGIPIYLPQASTPSPVSISSERGITSPLAGCTLNSQQPSGKTIGDVLPSIRTKSRSRDIWSRPQCQQQNRKHSSRKLLAPRAGTSGFRAPEVLIQCPHQTTSVDVWSAGVMFLSLLSGRYPFFRPADDMESLAQMIAVFGTEKVKKLAKCCGKKLTSPFYCSGHNLKNVVETFRKISEEKKEEFIKPVVVQQQPGTQSPAPSSNSPSTFTKDKTQKIVSHIYPPPYSAGDIPASAYNLLDKLLDVNPLTRLSAKEALEHEFFNESF